MFKRQLGFGTFFEVIITGGLWLLAIPFYPKRGTTSGEQASIMRQQTLNDFFEKIIKRFS